MTKMSNEWNLNSMSELEHRTNVRYEDFARITCPEICFLQGVLLDVSESGCKIRFPVTVDIDYDKDYEVTIQPSCKAGLSPFTIVVHPVWEDDSKETPEVGFVILHSPGIPSLIKYLEILHNLSLDSEGLLLQELCL